MKNYPLEYLQQDHATCIRAIKRLFNSCLQTLFGNDLNGENFNFGPNETSNKTVKNLIDGLSKGGVTKKKKIHTQ